MSCLKLFSFFISSSRAPRALHSFPTRRSSDLPSVHLTNCRGGCGGYSCNRLLHFGAVDASSCCCHRCLCGGSFPQDRKSTRLNSSHVKISYAVFCLKKKKQKNENTRAINALDE